MSGVLTERREAREPSPGTGEGWEGATRGRAPSDACIPAVADVPAPSPSLPRSGRESLSRFRALSAGGEQHQWL